ncbi:MAG: nucleotidyltransferase [Rickettsia aeschlimannii]
MSYCKYFIATPEQKECFELLQKAYVDARYDKNYKIIKEQLLYLIDRVEKLKEITERIYTARINQ